MCMFQLQRPYTALSDTVMSGIKWVCIEECYNSLGDRILTKNKSEKVLQTLE